MELSGHAMVALMADLRGADLSGLALAAIDLEGKNISGANLSGSDLSGAVLRKCALSGANLSGANLADACLEQADLSRVAAIGARLERADLASATLDEADLDRADLNSARLHGASLCKAHLREATLRGADLTKADLSRADLKGADLLEADLTDANFDDADLAGTRVEGAQLLATSLPEHSIRCPICTRKGVFTQVRYWNEDTGQDTIPFYPWPCEYDVVVYFGSTRTMQDCWPCGHLSDQAHQLLFGNSITLDDDGSNWLGNVLAAVKDRLGLDDQTAEDLMAEVMDGEILECIQGHFDMVMIDTGDRWGSYWGLPFAENPAEALCGGCEDLLELAWEKREAWLGEHPEHRGCEDLLKLAWEKRS